MSENNAADKLVGSQYLDLATLKKNVADANKQLNTIGKNIKFDFSKQIADEIKRSVEQTAKNLNVTLPVTSGSSNSDTKSKISELERQEKVQIRAYTTLTKLKKSMLSTEDKASAEYLQKGVAAVEQQIQKNNVLISQRKTEVGYAKSMATVTEARQRSEKAIVQAQTKASAKPEEEVLDILKQQAKIKDEMFKIDKLIVSASDEDRIALTARKEARSETNSILEDNKRKLFDQNDGLEDNEKVQKQINVNLEKEIAHRQSIDKATKQQQQAEKDRSEAVETIRKTLTALVTVYAANALKEFWNDSIEYGQKYYDLLTEIRIVSGANEEAALKMGERYRNMAQEMSVSSVEIAEAATEFWRQGLDNSEVNARLKDTTQYAKISGQEFKEAAEQVTAATNSMNLDSQRVVDVFSYLGDASASGADEIGIAMQKASASALEAGVSFEWLGAYIATVSEKTRQAPEAIGTAFNSIMARIQSIKQKGFNEEDETKINDVAKALSNIDVALLDNEGNWRDMSDIFLEIAGQWEALDDKARAYLATTIAGTRQKNVFLTLMNDMSLMNSETGEASRAMELYEGAITSAGAATEKYAIWSESVSAAQGRMKAAFEEVYALLDANWLKGFYDGLANIASGFADVTDSVHGLNVIIPIVAVGLYSLVSNVSKLGGLSGVISAITASVSSFGIAAPLAMAAGVGALTLIGTTVTKTETDITESLESVSESLDSIKTSHDQMEASSQKIENLREKYINLSTDTNLTKQEQEELDRILEEIARLSPDLANAVEGVTGKYSYQATIVAGLNKELREKQRLQAAEAREAARGNFSTLVETGKQIHSNKSSMSDKVSLVDEFLNARKGNESTDLTSFVQNYARNYVDAMLESYQYIEGGFDQLAYEMGEATDFKVFSSTYEELISQFSDWLLNEWTAVQDEATQLASQENTWKQQIADTLSLWGDTSQFETEQYRMIGEAAVKEILAGFDYDGDIESQLHVFSGKIMEKITDLLLEEATSKQDPVKYALMNQLEEAFDEAFEKRTPESMAKYNDLVDQWNALGGTPFQHLTEDLLAVAEASEDAADGVGKTLTAAEKYAETTRKRDALKSARTSGFSSYLDDLSSALGPDGTDLTAYKAKLNEIYETNSSLYEAMMDTYPDLAQIEGGAKAGQDALHALAGLKEQAETEAKYWQQYYEAAAHIPSADSGEAKTAQEMLLAMKDALVAGGEEDGYGVVAALDLLSTFGEGAIDILSQVIPGIETLTEDTITYQELLNLINESLIGTYENAVGFIEELSNMDSISDSGMVDVLSQFQEMLSTEEGVKNFRKAWSETDDDVKKSIKSLFDEGEEFFDLIEDGGKDAEDVFKDVNKELKKLELDNLIKYGQIWEEVGEITDANTDNAEELHSTYGEFEKKLDDLIEAQGNLNYLMETGNFTTDEGKKALENLSEVCGRTISSEEDQALAQQYLASQMGVASNSSAWLLNYLYGICGSEFNSSSWQSQLAALGNSGNAAAQIMLALIQTLRAIDGTTVDFSNGVFDISGLGNVSGVKIPSVKPSGGGSSGGDSKNSSSNEMSEIEKMLDLMKQIQDIRDHQMDLIQEARSYYETTGELQGVIKYYEKERDAILDNNQVLEDNITKIESLMFAKQKEVAAMTTSDDAYEQAAKDLEGLQEAHQEYTQQLLENRTAVEELTRSIKEQQDEIRDMEIELRETIMDAIKDREELNERMLQGTIDVENEVMDVITKRYEKERDMAIEAAEAKREALEQEKSYLREQFEARKALAEEEDKQKELVDLQAKLARISADPTRKKEELELRQKIADLRDEMAWDLAEQEVEAQEKSIDQQIESLDEYIEYVENYYEDLFEHPQKLLEEVEKIMRKTDEEILRFLAENNEEFANSSTATQESMTNAWKDMLMDMRGETQTHWEEVESIIQQGDEAIIEFLKENSADYKAAGKLQAEKYVDEWKSQLSNLKKAYKDLYEEVKSYDYASIVPSISSGGGSSGGSSGGGTSSSSKVYKFRFKKKDGSWSVNYGGTSVYDAFKTAQSEAIRYWNNYINERGVKDVIKLLQSATANNPGAYLKQFKLGGLARFTGPAWLDGTQSAPERILSPYQTKLFEDMIGTLHAIKVSAPSMPANIYEGNAQSEIITFGDIIVNVEELSDQTDYKDLADRIMEEIMSRMTRGSAVGGIRKTR